MWRIMRYFFDFKTAKKHDHFQENSTSTKIPNFLKLSCSLSLTIWNQLSLPTNHIKMYKLLI